MPIQVANSSAEDVILTWRHIDGSASVSLIDGVVAPAHLDLGTVAALDRQLPEGSVELGV